MFSLLVLVFVNYINPGECMYRIFKAHMYIILTSSSFLKGWNLTVCCNGVGSHHTKQQESAMSCFSWPHMQISFLQLLKNALGLHFTRKEAHYSFTSCQGGNQFTLFPSSKSLLRPKWRDLPFNNKRVG